MHIHVLGLSHRTAQVDLRERIALNEDAVRATLTRLGGGPRVSPDRASEAVILSTCSRTELYLVSSEPEIRSLAEWISGPHGVGIEEVLSHSYQRMDRSAVRHLLRVAAGLDSPILGEPQILGQVGRALELAQQEHTAGPILSRLFSTAVHAGKRARSETKIGRNPASAASLAARLAEQSASNLTEAQVVIVGAGEMAELAVEALRKRGVHKLTVVNRTADRAQALGRRWQARVSTFDGLADALATADILITSTGAPQRIIAKSLIDEVMRARPHHPLLAIDIAVPRDIDPQAGLVPGVSLYDLDSLNQQLEQSLQARVSEVPRVEVILAEEGNVFLQHFESQAVLPLVADLRNRAEEIRQRELRRTLRRMPELTETERKRIDSLTLALVKKLIDAPIARLRVEAQRGNGVEYAALARDLYGLSDSPTAEASAAATRPPEAQREP